MGFLRINCLRLLVPFLILGLSTACNEKPLSPSEIESEKKAICAVWDQINEAFLAKDWESYSKHFVHSSDFQLVHSYKNDWLDGWDAFQARYKSLVTAEGNWNFTTTRFDVTISRQGDSAWAMIGFVFSEDEGPEFHNIEHVVFLKEDGQWKAASALVALIQE
jgi:hypothetical protein